MTAHTSAPRAATWSPPPRNEVAALKSDAIAPSKSLIDRRRTYHSLLGEVGLVSNPGKFTPLEIILAPRERQSRLRRESAQLSLIKTRDPEEAACSDPANRRLIEPSPKASLQPSWVHVRGNRAGAE
jgi:hypothetical protein